jgi:hypothetical protein
MTSPQDPGQPWMQDPNQAPFVDPTAPASSQPSSSQPGYPPTTGYPTQPGYPQSGYTQPAYPQAGYQQPGYGGYPPPGGYQSGYPIYVQPPQSTNTLAVVALVLAFVFAPAAIVCGHIARKQIRTSGESGDGLALAGLICGYVFTAGLVIVCGIYAVLIATVVSTGDSGTDALRLALSYM